MSVDVQALLRKALEVRERAYVPYSHFKVGCAVLCEDGQIQVGCNIENAAFGPTNCAERTALFRLIADGHMPHSFKALLVVGETEEPITPCGVCRQVMSELCHPDMPVYMANINGKLQQTTVAALLPGAFSLGGPTRE